MSVRRLAMVSCALVIAGCATTRDYIYSPYGASQWRDGYQATVIAVPPEAPTGNVEISSFGIVEITPDGAGTMSALHVRMAVTNSGDDPPWTVATEESLIEIPGEGQARALFVNSDQPALPSATVARGQLRVFDFYFPLPSTISSESELGAFDFSWKVTTSARPFPWRTRFTRAELAPPPRTDVVLVTGWGPYWWFNPVHPFPGFHHHRPFLVPRPPGRVIVAPPRGHRHVPGRRR